MVLCGAYESPNLDRSFNFGFGPMNGYQRTSRIMKYIESELSSGSPRAIADHEALPDIPSFANLAFDGDGPHLSRIKPVCTSTRSRGRTPHSISFNTSIRKT
jgi:hypothetical protein